jgi:hypothetical protein
MSEQHSTEDPLVSGGHWASDEAWPMEDWKYDVSNDDTRLGYRDWVKHQKATAEKEA